MHKQLYYCLVVWNIFYFPYIGNVIIPIDFSEGFNPSTSQVIEAINPLLIKVPCHITSFVSSEKRHFKVAMPIDSNWNGKQVYSLINKHNNGKSSFIVDLPVEHGDFPYLCESLPEGSSDVQIQMTPLFPEGFDPGTTGKYSREHGHVGHIFMIFMPLSTRCPSWTRWRSPNRSAVRDLGRLVRWFTH